MPDEQDIPADAPTEADIAPRVSTGARLEFSPAEREKLQERTQRRTLSLIRLVYLVLLVIFTLLPFVATVTKTAAKVSFGDYWVALLLTFLFGAIVLTLDALTPHRRLASLAAVYLGFVVGLLATLAISPLMDIVLKVWDLTGDPWDAYALVIKLALGITICYVTITTILTTKDDFRLVIPYVEFARQVRGVRPLVIDTSVLIDGRIERLGDSGFFDAPVIVPQFVIDELQTLADSGDRTKRARGRRGLDIVGTIQLLPELDVTIDTTDPPGHAVDHKLVELAHDQNLRLLTTDHNLEKVARIRGVGVLNLNDLSQILRPPVLTGDHIKVEVVKRGEGDGQGVGYLADGTMVVIEEAGHRLGENLPLVVSNALQTTAGRMVFATIDPQSDEQIRVERIADSATGQTRSTTTPDRRSHRRGRNPRR